jgi:hypothetical protein
MSGFVSIRSRSATEPCGVCSRMFNTLRALVDLGVASLVSRTLFDSVSLNMNVELHGTLPKKMDF